MSKRSPVPSYRLHKPTGQAVVTIRTSAGDRRDVYLGKYNTPESRAEYRRVLRNWTPRRPPSRSRPERHAGRRAGITVDGLVVAFWEFAQKHYRRPDGTPTQEISEYFQTFKVLRALYAEVPAADFGPLALKAIRNEMIERQWARSLVNARVNRIRRTFKWAASEQLVPVAVFHALQTVAGLQRDRSAAQETEPVEPVAWEHVRAVLPFLRPDLRAIVEVQYLTGMRPSEVRALRPADIDTSADVWLFKPV